MKNEKSKYELKKQEVRKTAIEWSWCSSIDEQVRWMYEHDVIDVTAYFRKLGRRYGLLREFYENGII